MKIMVEAGGLLTSLINAAFDSPQITGRATTVLDELLHPHTTQDLYEGVIYRLRTIKKNSTIYSKIMPLFFPEDRRSRDISNEDYSYNDLHPQLYKGYKQKFEDCIIEYVTTDALDIIKRVQTSYTNSDSNYNISRITGDVYFGTIIKQVYEGPYDLVPKLVSTYKQFVKDSKLKQWQTTSDQSKERNHSSISEIKDALMDQYDYSSREIDEAIDNIRITPQMTDADIITALIRYMMK